MNMSNMKYAHLPGINKDISRIAQDCMMFTDATQQDLDEAFTLMGIAVASGVNCFDNSHMYRGGGSDRAVGAWMQARKGWREMRSISFALANFESSNP